jgi:hypothetical protein
MSILRICVTTICVAAFAIIGISCSEYTRVAGWGSETTNGVTASIYKSDGSPAVGAIVRLRRSDYVTLPPTSLTKLAIYGADALTDAEGHFEIMGIDPGSYSIEVIDPSTSSGQGGAVLFSCSIDMSDTVDFGADTLRPCATIKGSIDTSGISGKRLFVQVLGLERLASVDSAGGFRFNDLPAGLFGLRIIAAMGTQATVVRTDQVSAVSGDTVSITMPGWGFAKRFFLNTTSGGAAVAGAVTDFPVLIRLTSSNFNFTQAKSGGEDIRFTKSDGSPLPYDIERWDAVNNQAEIWIKVDTIFGNDSAHSITMYWGASAGSASNSSAVFDTTNGYRGVWHMADNAANSTVKDATGRNNGIMRSDTAGMNTSVVSITGVAGGAAVFHGRDNFQWVDLGANRPFINGKKEITISLWMNADVDTYESKELFCFSKGGTLSSPSPESRISVAISYDKIVLDTRPLDNGPSQDVTSTQTFMPLNWYHVVGIMKIPKDSIYLYVNGVQWIASSVAYNVQATDATNSTNSSIGANDWGKDDYFNGKIDEARLEDKARSPDWIKLSYENQKAADALVKWK